MNEISSELVEYIINKYRDKEIPWHKIKMALHKIKKRQMNYCGIVSMEICKYYQKLVKILLIFQILKDE